MLPAQKSETMMNEISIQYTSISKQEFVVSHQHNPFARDIPMSFSLL